MTLTHTTRLASGELHGHFSGTQIFVASTSYGLTTLVAAIDTDRFADAEERILVVSNNGQTPEAGILLQEMSGFAELCTRFDRVHSLNTSVAPQHPSSWRPRWEDTPAWQRLLRHDWGIAPDTDVHLICESIQVPPSLSLSRVFVDAPIDVYADGLMSYGPTRNLLSLQVGSRLRRLHHLDLIPGLDPLLLSEFDVTTDIIDTEAFRTTMARTGSDAVLPDLGGPAALLIGQYLSPLEILTVAEEEELHADMVRLAARHGHRRIIFKPHPGAPSALVGGLAEVAANAGAELIVFTEPVLAETLFERLDLSAVIGCFSTALMTAATVYRLPVGRVGTAALLQRLAPYQNSNRIPLSLIHALVPDLVVEPPGPVRPVTPWVQGLVTSVGYAMQAEVLADRRTTAVAWLAEHYAAATEHFKRRRLTKLDLPGGLPPRFGALTPHVRIAAARARDLRTKINKIRAD
ncbi:MAG: alpha-2,8-polysialyltransferase family protein [Propionibacteriales bacterium]|nr:alpha-2,8-polysialyltransferase family protein [Propionibacteriales bacterium]